MAQEFISGTIPPAVSFSTERVAPPSPLYVGREDRLIIRSWDATAVAGCSLRGRVMLPGGFVQVFNFDHGFDGTRALGQQFLPLPEGFLLSLIVETGAVGVRRGQAFVEVGLVRGQGTQSFRTAKLISGYVSDITPLAWPGDTLEDSLDGAGLIRLVLGTDPAAGVEVSEAVPTNARWRILMMRIVLATDATAANRRMALSIASGGSQVFAVHAVSVQTASLTRRYICSPLGAEMDVRETYYNLPIPALPLLSAGMTIGTTTTAIQAGDNYERPQMLIEEWLEE